MCDIKNKESKINVEEADFLLWEFFSKNHDLTLTDGEVNDIVEEVKKYLKAVNSE